MSGTNRLLIEQAPEGRRVCDASAADYRARRGDSIPSDIDYRLARKLERERLRLSRVEAEGVVIIINAWIYRFPVPKVIYDFLERASYRLLVFTRQGRKEKGGL